MTDPLLRVLANLPSEAPDSVHIGVVRARCHRVLVQTARRQTGPRLDVMSYWKPVVAGFGAIYLTEVLHQALRFYGVL